MKWGFKIFFALAAFALFQSCSVTKSVPEGDTLYEGAEIQISSEESKAYKKKLKGELSKSIKPKPNSSLFGFKWKLAFYNFLNPKKPKGIKAKIRKKFGEEPVLYSSVNPGFTKELLTAELFNRGFFHGIVTYQTVEEEKKTKIVYLINTGPSYRIKKYRIATFDSAITKLSNEASSKSFLRPGRRYNLDRLRQERERIDEELKNKGYYYFNADYLEFEADSIESTKEVSLKLDLKEEIPEKSIIRYTIRKALVVMDSAAYYDSTLTRRDTVEIDKVLLNVSRDFKPKPISRYIFLKQGNFYSREDHQLTLNRLMGMGLFRFVNLQIEEVDSSGLMAYIILSPLPKRALSAEIQAVTKSNNFVGPRASTSYSNRNFLKGGEKLTLNFHGSIETQLNGQFKGLYTYEFGPLVQLTVPRFLLPFNVKMAKLYTPSTVFSADYNFTRRVGFFDMQSFKFNYLYRWKETIAKDHEFTPLGITYFTIRNTTPEFNKIIMNDISLKRRYEDQMIASWSYSYTYNEQTLAAKRDQLYFNGNIETAGNLVSLMSRKEVDVNEEGRRTFAGIVYAQYARLSADFRHYHHINRKTQFVSRIMLGWGIPYGNSNALPYIRSFFAGGANSIRAFTVNSLGPGTYRVADTLQRAYFIQQGGDIKAEANIEYRFPLVSVLKGALFVDAGNTWLSRPNPTVPGGEFEWNKIASQIAVGAGFGFRVDLNFFIIRLDVAKPVRKPWLPPGKKWVGGEFFLGDKNWRQDNIIFNIAIGYPF